MDEKSGAADRISPLADDLLHLVLQRLRCARAAARTSILSRRWRQVYSGFPEAVVDVTLQDVPLGSLEAALRRAAGPRVRLLDIRVPGGPQDRSTPQFVAAAMVSSALRAAADLAPVELRFTLSQYVDWARGPSVVELPRFLRATSIELRGRLLDIRLADSAGFPLLERLTISGCNIDLPALIRCCPHLHVLTVDDFTVQSTSMRKLLVKRIKAWRDRDGRLDAAMLKKFTTRPLLHGGGEVRTTILAPMVEKVWCRRSYPKVIHGLGLWGLLEVRFESPEVRHGEEVLARVEVLSLHICAQGSFSFGEVDFRFGAEIDKHLVTHFSTLNLHLTTRGHVFGAFVLRLLGMYRLRDVRKLKIVLPRSEVKEAWPPNCPCDDPKGWRIQTVSLNLKEVKIEGFKGKDHELDFLKVVFRCSPMLKRVTVRLPDQDMPSDDWCMKIHNIFREYPFVEGNIDLVSG